MGQVDISNNSFHKVSWWTAKILPWLFLMDWQANLSGSLRSVKSFRLSNSYKIWIVPPCHTPLLGKISSPSRRGKHQLHSEGLSLSCLDKPLLNMEDILPTGSGEKPVVPKWETSFSKVWRTPTVSHRGREIGWGLQFTVHDRLLSYTTETCQT